MKGEEKNIHELLSVCIKNNIPFASFSMPKETGLTTFVQSESMPNKIKGTCFHDSKPGFIISPFERNDKFHSRFLLTPDYIFENNEINHSHIENLKGKVFRTNPEVTIPNETSEKEFIENVQTIVDEIEKGNLGKVVLSRVKVLKIENIQSILADLFLNLNNSYINAFCFLINIPNAGCWMGASPEPLLFAEDLKYHTVALAGTKFLNGIPIENVEWSVKEIHEQALVSYYIEEKLNNLKARINHTKGPYNYKAAHLVHLKTDFSFGFANDKDKLGNLLETLHPTPSVCGLPVNEAYNTISRLEKHDRSYYSGFLGPVNYNNESKVFVNLRCMQVVKNHFILYSGAGITEQSVPDKEWNETSQKLETLFSIIKNKVDC